MLKNMQYWYLIRKLFSSSVLQYIVIICSICATIIAMIKNELSYITVYGNIMSILLVIVIQLIRGNALKEQILNMLIAEDWKEM